MYYKQNTVGLVLSYCSERGINIYMWAFFFVVFCFVNILSDVSLIITRWSKLKLVLGKQTTMYIDRIEQKKIDKLESIHVKSVLL
jgi:hypothetical protein